MSARLLVTGAGTGPGNNVITSLRRGDPSLVVVGCHDDRFSIKKSVAEPNYLIPSAAHPSFIRALARIVAAEKIDLLIPTSDADVRAVSRHRTRIPCRVRKAAEGLSGRSLRAYPQVPAFAGIFD